MPEESRGTRVGRNVRALRDELMFTRAELARRAGLSVPGIEHIERGIIARPRRSTIEKLAHGLGVPVEDLLSEEPPSPKVEAPPLQRPLNGFLEEERRPVVEISAAAGAGVGAAASVLVGVDAHFDGIADELRAAGLGEEIEREALASIEEARGQLHRLVGAA